MEEGFSNDPLVSPLWYLALAKPICSSALSGFGGLCYAPLHSVTLPLFVRVFTHPRLSLGKWVPVSSPQVPCRSHTGGCWRRRLQRGWQARSGAGQSSRSDYYSCLG